MSLDKVEVYEKNDNLLYIGGPTSKYDFPCDGYVIVDLQNKKAHVFMVATSSDKQGYVDDITSIFKSVKVGDTSLYKDKK